MVPYWILGVLFIAIFGINNVQMLDSTNGPIVKTLYGDLRGIAYTVNGANLHKYLGIPFAQPPTGQRRFKPPEKPTAWSGVRDAIKLGNECLQVVNPMYAFVKGLAQREDCLFLNVYTPVLDKTTSPLPVMVWIHGGGYVIGSGQQYDGTYLAAQGVIVVTINYRLGAFGFLSTETDEMPGNYGMLDQVQALQWVKENIAAFGGDAGKVTLFGESAGGSSVSLLVLSPLSKGLFQRAIMESGSSLNPWAVYHPANHLTPRMFTNLLSSSVGCNDPATLLSCLQAADSLALHNASATLTEALSTGNLAPRVETVFGFLPELPIHLLTKGAFNDVETLRGFNSDESGMYVTDPKNEGLSIEDFKNTLKNVLFVLYGLTDQNQIIQDMVDLYIGNNTDPFLVRDRTVDAMSDFNFKAGIINEINLITEKSPKNKHYLYEFRYRPSYVPYPPWLTAVHADEVPFVFGVDSQTFKSLIAKVNDLDKAVSAQMITMWTNFAKTGNPSATIPVGAEKWESYSKSSPKNLLIAKDAKLHSYHKPDIDTFYLKLLNRLDTNLDPSAVVIG